MENNKPESSSVSCIENNKLEENGLNTSNVGNELDKTRELEERMEKEKIYYLVLRYSIPNILSMFVVVACIFLDRYWIGRLPGDTSMLAIAGIGISLVVTNTLMALCQLVGFGAASCISIKLGNNNKKSAQEIVNNGIMMTFAIFSVVLVLNYLYMEPLLFLVGASENTISYALEYSRITTYGFPFYILAFFLSCCISGTGKPKIFAITQTISIIANIILDPILIFGLDLKVKGAALATITSQFVWFICILYYYLSGRSYIKIKKIFTKPNFSICKEILSIGVSPFFLSISGTFVMIILNNRLKYYGDLELGNGDIAVGSMAVVGIILLFFLTPLMGINQGIQPLIGFNYGKKDIKRVREIYIWGCIYCFIVCAGCFIVTTFLGEKAASIFSNNKDVIKLTGKGMKIFLSAFVLSGFEISSVNLFQAMGKGKISIALVIMKQVGLIVPCYILLPKFLGLNGIWLSGPVVDILAVFVTIKLVTKELKIKSQNEKVV